MTVAKKPNELDRERELYRGTNSGPPSKQRDNPDETRTGYAKLRKLHPEWTVREIAAELGISKSHVHRLQLEEQGRDSDVLNCEVTKAIGKRFRKLAESRGHTLADEMRQAVEHWLASKECRE